MVPWSTSQVHPIGAGNTSSQCERDSRSYAAGSNAPQGAQCSPQGFPRPRAVEAYCEQPENQGLAGWLREVRSLSQRIFRWRLELARLRIRNDQWALIGVRDSCEPSDGP